MSVREIIDQLGSEFKKLSTYDRVVKAKKEFPDLTNKQLAEDIVICPVQKLRKHLAKARKQRVLPEAVEEPLKERAFSVDSSLTSKVHSIGWKNMNEERDSENEEAVTTYKISNQYRMITKEKLYADEAYGLSIGDKVIIEGKDKKKEHAICERFDIKKDKWKLRMQDNFQESLAERDDIEVFEVLKRKNAPKILSKASKNDMVFSVERRTEYRNGKKLPMPLTEIVKRPPNRSNNMPLLYQERPTWTVDEAKVLLSKCGVNVSFMIDMFMQQKEADAKWKDFCYVNKVSQCNIFTSDEEGSNKFKKSLGKWNNNLHTAGFQQIQIRTPFTEQSKLGVEEFMKTFGFPTINQSQRKKSRLGLSFDFIPQVCDYCDHHAVSMPVCECGESYCGPACRLAEWNNHSNICEQAMDNMMMVGMIDKLWMITRGYKTDCEGRVISMKS